MRERLGVIGRVWLFAIVAVVTCVAAKPGDTLGSFQHTAFLKKDGAPGDVAGMVQASDGFLWMIGTKGVTRFDGVTFTPFRPVAGERFEQAQVDRIVAAQNGGVWVTNARTGPTLIRDGHLRTFGAADGFTTGNGRFFTASDGTVWMGSPQGVRSFDEKRGAWMMRYPAGSEVPRGDGRFDADGNLWLPRVSAGPLVIPAGQTVAVPVDEAPADARKVLPERSGRVYTVSAESIRFFRRNGTHLTEVAKPLGFSAFGLIEDRDGNVWITSPARGVVFISRDAMAAAEANHAVPVFESMRKTDGLSGGVVWPVLQDREGNVWIGTESGIDRFSRGAFTQIRLPEGIHEVSAAVLSHGEVWVGNETLPVLHAHPPAPWQTTDIAKYVFAVFLDARTDTALIANTDGVWTADAQGYRPLASLPAKAAVGMPACIVRDSKGIVYTCQHESAGTVMRWDGTRWAPATPVPHMARSMAVGDDDAVWMAGRSSLVRLADGKTSEWGEKEGLRAGVLSAILPVAGGAWLGGEKGIQYFDGSRFVDVKGGNADAFVPTTGLYLDRHGNLWAHTLGGVARIDAASLAAAMGPQGKAFAYRLFDEADGVPGAPDPDRTLPTLRASADGRLWAQTTAGLAWIDPEAMPGALPPPRPVIEYMVTNAGDVALGKNIVLGGDVRAIRIGYTAAALTLGTRVHFRYRLRGLSDEWEDVGSRREAIFTNPPPGKLVFEVIAVGEDGETSGTPMRLAFSRDQAMHETTWFRALAFLPLLALIWLWYRVRTRSLKRRMRIRADERDAVARDIHDTLLQRFHGFSLTLQGMAGDERFPPSWRAQIAELAAQARDAIIEGRQRILSLRRSGDTGLALYDDLAAEGSLLQQRHGLAFVLDATGDARPLRPDCTHELRHIALEGMRNAFAHSKGTTVTVVLNYASDALWLSVADDGTGMPVAGTTSTTSHFGLVGLRERVGRIGGVLNIDTAPGEGTELHVRIPARRAYMPGSAMPPREAA